MQSTGRRNQNISLTALAIRRQILVYSPEYHSGEFKKNVVFGPNYKRMDSPFWENAKEQALEKVLEYSQCTLSELLSTMRTIEDEARAAYAVDVLNNLTGPDFLMMMALDGCFFLLLSFSILGMGWLICETHPIFGIGCADENMAKWLKSMFIVGNQLPYVVVEILMDLRFFQELRTMKKWKQPLELAEKVLHRFIMVRQEGDPLDLLHCLQSIVLGTKNASNVVSARMVDDMESFPSAKSLSELGISFGKLQRESGSRGINYKPYAFSTVLYLPVLRVDKYTEMIFDSVKKYEIAQQEVTGIERQASSFFKFLSELIRTPGDIEVLSSQGVIQGKPESLLRFLSSFNELVASEHLCHLRTQIRGNPQQGQKLIKLIFKPATIICSILLLFAYLPWFVHHMILGYYRKINS